MNKVKSIIAVVATAVVVQMPQPAEATSACVTVDEYNADHPWKKGKVERQMGVKGHGTHIASGTQFSGSNAQAPTGKKTFWVEYPACNASDAMYVVYIKSKRPKHKWEWAFMDYIENGKVTA